MSRGAARDASGETTGARISTMGGRYLCIILNRENEYLVVQPGTHQGKLLEHGYPQWEVGISVLYWTDRTDVWWCNQGLSMDNYWSMDIHNGRLVSLYYAERTEQVSGGAARDSSGKTSGARISLWEVGISVLYWTDRTDAWWCSQGRIRGNYWSTGIHNGRLVSLYWQ